MPFAKPLPDAIASFIDKVSSGAVPAAAVAANIRVQRIRRAAFAVALAGGAVYYLKNQKRAANKRALAKALAEEENKDVPLKVDRNNIKVAVDKRFLNQLRYIFKICVPNMRSKTIGILVLHTTFLILRTYLSVIVARLDGRLVRDLVAADARSFGKGLFWWFAVAIPATYTNSMVW